MAASKHQHGYVFYDHAVTLALEDIALEGRLTVPEGATNIVIFAHGSGSSRFSPRNWYVAETLHFHHIATLVIDLLSEEEALSEQHTRHLRFDIQMLANRLAQIAHWVSHRDDTAKLSICFFGSSTGAAAALVAAAETTEIITSIVSRGGRPDLARDYLSLVTAPTLLIVGGCDTQVIALNEQALEKLNEHSKLQIIPGATHLFEEKGTLEQVAHAAASWFKRHGGHTNAVS